MDEIDLHGLRFHEARERVLAFVDQCVVDGDGCCRIIHGHGVIAQHLPEWLAEYPLVARWEIEFGNSGSTVVWLE